MNGAAEAVSDAHMPAKMRVEQASKVYQTKSGGVHALDNVSIDVREGEFLCLLGPSGCGKSTLLWSMAGLHGLTSGKITLGSDVISKPHPEIAMIFQEANLLPWRNLGRNIELPFEIKKQAPNRERIQKLLKRVGLEGFENKYPRELSGGMQQRANLCRALIHEPELLMLDEPFGALDALTRLRMQDLLLKIHETRPTTVVLVTHDVEEALYLADRVVVLHAGAASSIARVIEVPGIRPRDRADSVFTRLRAELLAELGVHPHPAPEESR